MVGEIWIDSNRGWLRTYIVTADGVKLLQPEKWIERRGARIGLADLGKYTDQLVLIRFKDPRRPEGEDWELIYIDRNGDQWVVYSGFVKPGQCVSLMSELGLGIVVIRLVQGKRVRICLRFDVEVEQVKLKEGETGDGKY
jgi:hypothetical protein